MRRINKKEERGASKGTLAIIVLLVVLFVVIVLVITGGNRKKENNQVAQQPQTQTETQPQTETETPAEENTVSEPVVAKGPSIAGTQFIKEENGVKVNTSSKLTQDKKFGIFTFSDIRIETNELTGSIITATVTADSTTKTPEKEFTINILDEQGEIVATLGGYIGNIKPGESITLSAGTTTDITNAYDFTIVGL